MLDKGKLKAVKNIRISRWGEEIEARDNSLGVNSNHNLNLV